MKKQHGWSSIILVVGLALVATSAPPVGAAPAAPVTSSKAAADRRAAFRRLGVERLRARSGTARATAAPAAPVQSAADGDALTLLDPAGDASPPAETRADIRQVLVGNGGGGSLLFTMQMETYSNPLTDPAWMVGFTGAFWFVDTSGDNVPEVIVEIYHTGSSLEADVFDPEGEGTFVCNGTASTNATTKSYTVRVPEPGCFGDVKRPAVAGGFNYDLPSAPNQAQDFAPNNGNLVRFNRPPAGQPEGGYTVVTRSAGFQRLGALPIGATPSGRFQDYIGPRPVIAAASARPFDPGLWSVTDDGEVSTQDDGEYYGDATDFNLFRPIVGMAVLPNRSGYWLVASDGGIFSFGDAAFFGSTGGTVLNKPVVGMAATPTGQGYWLVASDGGIFAYGDARFYGSTGSIRLNRPVVGMAAGYQGQGYWLVASDGGIFAYGMPFYGSTGGIVLQQPIVGMAATRSGGGYRFIARDGGVFSYGDAEFHGSIAAPGRTDVVGLATA